MKKLELSVAVSDYDHVRDLMSGRVVVEGIDLIPLTLSIEEIFYRFSRYREWDISEMSFAKYVSMIAEDDKSLTAIPVFPSRIFRHSAIYIRRDSGIAGPEDLAGRKVGIPEWAQTAGVYVRGWLAETVGLALSDIAWYQAGVNQPGRVEKVALNLPPGIAYETAPGKSLSGMLVEGEIDAAITAHPPTCYKQGHPDITRLYEDYRPAEEAYWRESGIFPIMHVIAVKRAVLDRHPWIAMNMLTAFEQAKENSIERAREITAPRFPIPWCSDDIRKAEKYFDGPYWPYGVEPNRKTLETFLRFAFDQGICRRRLAVEELFAPETAGHFKV